MSVAVYHNIPDVIKSPMEGVKSQQSNFDSILHSAMVTPEVRQQTSSGNIIESAMPEHKRGHKGSELSPVVDVPATGFTLGNVGYPGSHLDKGEHKSEKKMKKSIKKH